MSDAASDERVTRDVSGFRGSGARAWARLRELWPAPAFRTVLYAAAAFAVLVAVVIALTFVAVTRAMTADSLRTLGAEARIVAEVARQTSYERAAAILAEERRADPHLVFLLIDNDGRRYASAFPDQLGAELLARDRSVPHALAQSVARPDLERRGLHAAVMVPAADNGAVLLARPLKGITALSRQLLWALAFAALLIAGAATALGLFAASRTARRVARINAVGKRVMGGDLTRRLPISENDDDIDRLALTVNAMLGRIEELVAGVRHVSDSLAHDLRTPLNRLRTRAETVLREAETLDAAREGLARTIEDADRLIRTFNEMLLAGRLDAGAQQLGAEPFDIAAVCDDLVDFYAPLAEDQDAAIVRDGLAGPAMIAGSRQLLGQALTNLIENALKYGRPPSGDRPFAISVAVRSGRTPGTLEIEVADPGRGIAEADRARAVQRFVRLDDSRSTQGTGLGLSLVAAIARAHGGSLSLEDNAPGLRSILILPAASA
jgi:signal transduction histidine kinase